MEVTLRGASVRRWLRRSAIAAHSPRPIAQKHPDPMNGGSGPPRIFDVVAPDDAHRANSTLPLADGNSCRAEECLPIMRVSSPLRTLLSVLLLAFSFVAPADAQVAPRCVVGGQPSFVSGFQLLKETLGATMGQAEECEQAENSSGDTRQRTTLGLAFYRQSTGTPTFTNGNGSLGPYPRRGGLLDNRRR